MIKLKNKQCLKCKEIKLLGEFHKRYKDKDLLKSQCIECLNVYKRKWKEENPNNWREKHFRRKFNITLDEYNAMLKKQENKCFICQQPEIRKDKRTGKVKALAVDHCHKTGKIRKLLCDACNTALGLIHDNIDSALRIVQYLDYYQKDSDGNTN